MDQFQDHYGEGPATAGFVPGRVNLIGEHTDYNGGAVLPTALSLGTTVALSPRLDGRLRVVSESYETAERNLDDAITGHWSDYTLGAVRKANELGWLKGADIAVSSTVPAGAGLSSSASLLVNILKCARTVAKADMSDSDIAHLAREVETDIIGVPCGIMDQMAVALAAPGRALFLDTHTMSHCLIDLPNDPVVAVLHSGVERELSDGRYKLRAQECAAIKAQLGRDDICRVDIDEVDTVDDPILHRRLHHCISEHRRTIAAANVLRSGEFRMLGNLMIESHASMRDDFAITTPEIDALVDTCLKEGAIGARMTGGGFGGCIVALVASSQLETWRERVFAQHDGAYYVA
jgi:galactokinase